MSLCPTHAGRAYCLQFHLLDDKGCYLITTHLNAREKSIVSASVNRVRLQNGHLATFCAMIMFPTVAPAQQALAEGDGSDRTSRNDDIIIKIGRASCRGRV